MGPGLALVLVLVTITTPALAVSPTPIIAGGSAPRPQVNCVPAEVTRALREQSEARFGAATSAAPAERTLTTLFADPMGGGINSFGRTVVNYVDLDGTSGVRDWMCGAVTYNGHDGIDIEIRDFYDMDEGVPILAAASGIATATHDGEFDRQTQWISGAPANYVIVRHADASYAYYWHLRKGSVRIPSGTPVATGDTLGMIGSSGFSSGPHLHFKTWDSSTLEPYSGACQPNPTRWVSPGPYVWDLPFELFNHGLTTLAVDWPTICERPPDKTHVSRGASGTRVYSWIRSRNLSSSDPLRWKVHSPLGLWSDYSWYPSGSYSSSWWNLSYNLPSSAAYDGGWRMDILRNGVQIAQQFFNYDGTPNQLPVVPRQHLSVPLNGSVSGEFGGTDPDGSIFEYQQTTPAQHGTVTMHGGRKRFFRYVPATGFSGVDSVQVRAKDDEGALGPVSAIRFLVDTPLAVEGPEPTSIRLAVAPNPVLESATFACEIAHATRVSLAVYDVNGARVRLLEQGMRLPGAWRARWDARDARGRRVAAGIYFVGLEAGTARDARRIVVAP